MSIQVAFLKGDNVRVPENILENELGYDLLFEHIRVLLKNLLA